MSTASHIPLAAATRDPASLAGPDRLKLGYLFVLAVPLAAGISTLKNLEIAGQNYTGWIWMAMLTAGIALIAVEKAVHRYHSRLLWQPWLAWLAVVWVSLLWCESRSARNVQDAVQISMPLMVAFASALFVRSVDDLRRLLQMYWVALGLLTLCVVAHKVGILGDGAYGPGIAPRVLSLTATLIGCVLVARWPSKALMPWLGWFACVAITFALGSRMATAALLAVPILHPGYGSLWRRGLLIAVTLGMAIGLFYTPVFQQRFFASGSGTLGELFRGEFLGFGRFYAWPLILEEALRQPVLGHGIGSAYDFVPTVWEGMRLAHNDYLRIGFELGLVGLFTFLAVVAWQLMLLAKWMGRCEGPVRQGLAASLLGMMVFLVTACTDNTLIYNLWYMNPLFALLGASVSLARDGQGRKAEAGKTNANSSVRATMGEPRE